MAQSSASRPVFDLEALFEEYLARREHESKPECADLLEHAGEHAPDLLKRIRFYEAIRRTASLMHDPSFAEEDEHDPLLLLESLENYENLQRIGRGGQARVYKCFDTVLGRDVAIKFLRLERVAPDEVDRLLQAEAQALGRLTSPCVVTVHSLSKLGNVPYMVMEYVLAPTLREVFNAIEGRPLLGNDPRPDAKERVGLLARCAEALTPLPARIRFLTKLAEALEYCHDQGVLHRDIKPENILVDCVDGVFVPRLVDFGLSFSERREDHSLALSERFLVTLAYSAPEQLVSEKLGSSPKAEQFSFASVAYEFLTGVHPFEPESDDLGLLGATRSNVMRAAPRSMCTVRPEIPADLAAIIGHAHELEPNARYDRMGDLAKDLEALLNFRSISIQRRTVLGESTLFLRRHRNRLLRWGLGIFLVLSVPLTLFVADARSVRSELRAEFGALREQAGKWSKSWDFEAGWKRHNGLSARARELDQEFLWSSLFGGLQHEVDSTAKTLSDGMTESMQRQVEERNLFMDSGLSVRREVRELWKVPLAFERASRPDALIRLDLPLNPTESFISGLDQPYSLIQKQIAPESLPLPLALSPRDAREYLGQGSYRYSSWEDPEDPIATYELQFTVPMDRPPEPGRFSRDRLESMRFIEEFSREFFIHGGEDENGAIIEGSLPLPYPIQGSSFYVSERVTWSELAQGLDESPEALTSALQSYLGGQELPPVPDDVLRLDAPALASPETAMRYALAVGARLPTASELLYAYEQALLEIRDASGEEPDRIEGELTGTYHPTNRMLVYLKPEQISRNTVMQSVRLVDTARDQGLYCFRIARTHATLAEREKR